MFKRWRRGLRSDVWTVILFVLAFFVVAIIVYPFLVLVLKSVGIANYSTGEFTFDYYKKILDSDSTIRSLVNTLTISIGITMLTFFIGGSLAWLVTRSDFRYKKTVRYLVFLTFAIPSYILGISWLEFFGRNGYLNRLFNFLGMEYGIRGYSFFAVVFVMSIHLYPMVFLAMSHAFRTMDNSLEEAAIVSGASKTKVFFTITLPLVMPSMWAAGLFVFSRGMANFGVPALLLMPLYKQTLTTGIYSALNNLDFSSAAAISMVLVVLSALVFILQQVLVRKKRFTTISSTSSAPRLWRLGRHGTWIAVLVLTFQFLTTVLPVIVITTTSFLKRWGLPLEAKNFTLMNYVNLATDTVAVRAFRNSFLYGCSSALIAIVISLFIGYIVYIKRYRFGKVLEFIASAPMVIPNIVLAIGAIFAWNKGVLNFYGKASIIIITYTCLFLPIVSKQVVGIIQNQDTTLQDAARVSGASTIRAMRDILLPFLRSGMKSGWILCMLIALREIPISLMLYASGTETVGVLLFNMRSNSSGLEATSTVAVVVIALSLLGRSVVKKLNGSKGVMIENKSEI